MTHWNEVAYKPTQIELSCPTCKQAAQYSPAIIVELTRSHRDLLPRQCDWIEFDVNIDRVWPDFSESGVQVTLCFRELVNGQLGTPYRECRSHSMRTNQRGTVLCTNCGKRRKHDLNWPSDAWYKIDVKEQVLWAWNRKDAYKILEFIACHHRPKPSPVSCLRNLPAFALDAKNRQTIMKRLTFLLERNDLLT